MVPIKQQKTARLQCGLSTENTEMDGRVVSRETPRLARRERKYRVWAGNGIVGHAVTIAIAVVQSSGNKALVFFRSL